jgi:hypothetical protein
MLVELAAHALPVASAASAQPRVHTIFMLGISAQMPQTFTAG